MRWFHGSKTGLVLFLGVLGLLVGGTGQLKADFTCGTPTNVGSPPNSSANESGPSISKDGLELYFASDRPGSMGGDDIWVSTRNTINDPWGEPNNLNELAEPNNPVNSKFNDAQPSISGDGLELYFQSNRPDPNDPNKTLSDIWVTKRSLKDPNKPQSGFTGWGKAVNLGSPVNTSDDEWDPSISSDSLVLYFTSTRRTPYDVYYEPPPRIWVSSRNTKNDRWKDPFWIFWGLGYAPPMSPTSMPSISSNSLKLFFASGSYKMYSPLPGGYGSFDLYVTERVTVIDPVGYPREAWAWPVNLGPCVNTAYADSAPCISFDGSLLYFSDYDNPRKPAGFGGCDLWQVSSTCAGGRFTYVDCTATGKNDGSNWQDAFNYLQDALAEAQSCDEVLVAKGTYKPDQGARQKPGDRNATFQLKNCVTIRGGYAGFGEPDPNARDIKAYESVLSGDIGIPGDRSDNTYHVVTGYGINRTAILDGFTIAAGDANGQDYPLYQNRGGGMYNDRGSPTITNCTFSRNLATLGGGMYNYWGSPIVTNCIFSGNSSINRGGGMYNDRGSATVINCTFNGNTAGIHGGAMAGSDVTLANCILWGNTPEEVDSPEGTTVITYSDVQGGWPGEGNIDVDPCFAETGHWDPNGTPEEPNDDFWVEGDYHLRWDSTCINAGDPNFVVTVVATDIDGEPRIISGRVDMGCDEVCEKQADFTRDWIIDMQDIAIFVQAWLSTPGEEKWCVLCDLNKDDIVNLADWAKLAKDWLWQADWCKQRKKSG